MELVKKYWAQSYIRYIVVGVSVLAIELLIIEIGQMLGLSAVAAVAMAFWIALLLSFGMQKLVAFKDRRLGKRILGWQFAAYSALVLWNFGFTLLVTAILQNILPAVVCRVLALGITTVWNYYLYKTHIFRKPTTG